MACPPLSQTDRRRFLRCLALGLPVAAWIAVGTPWLRAGEVGDTQVQNFRLPVFRPDGRMLRHLRVASGSGPLNAMRLERGQVDFYGGGAESKPVAVINFQDAHLDSVRQIVTGENTLQFIAEAGGTLAGRGYRYENRESHLALHADVVGDFGGTRLAAPTAHIRFDLGLMESIDAISEVLFPEGVTVTGHAATKNGVESITAASARYLSTTGKLHLKGPIRLRAKGETHDADVDVMEFQLRPAAPVK